MFLFAARYALALAVLFAVLSANIKLVQSTEPGPAANSGNLAGASPGDGNNVNCKLIDVKQNNTNINHLNAFIQESLDAHFELKTILLTIKKNAQERSFNDLSFTDFGKKETTQTELVHCWVQAQKLDDGNEKKDLFSKKPIPIVVCTIFGQEPFDLTLFKFKDKIFSTNATEWSLNSVEYGLFSATYSMCVKIGEDTTDVITLTAKLILKSTCDASIEAERASTTANSIIVAAICVGIQGMMFMIIIIKINPLPGAQRANNVVASVQHSNLNPAQSSLLVNAGREHTANATSTAEPPTPITPGFNSLGRFAESIHLEPTVEGYIPENENKEP